MHTKHPKEFGFAFGLAVKVGAGRGTAAIGEVSDEARKLRDVVYVALVDSNARSLKIGQTRGTVLARWNGTLKVMNRAEDDAGMKKNERLDGDMLLQYTVNDGFSVWFKQAERVNIPYSPESGQFAIRSAEEDFLDWYYQPVMGSALQERLSRQRAGWSPELVKQTRRILKNPPLVSLSGGRLPLKNFNDSPGFIEVEDLLTGAFRVFNMQTGSSERFRSVSELIRAGWAID